MKLEYRGGRSHYEVTLDRKSYHFTKENNHVLEISDSRVINYIFSLPNRAEFNVVVPSFEVPVDEVPKLIKQDIPAEPIKKKPGRPKKEK